MPDETPTAPRRRRRSPDGEPWDGGAWVDVGGDNRWSPSFAERSRALLVLGILGGVLFLAAAVASIDDGDGDAEAATTGTSTTTETTSATTSTTAPLDPASLEGEDPPGVCADDDRDALPLRDRASSTVLVLNGSYRSGHANEANDELEELGYTSMQPANAPEVLDETLVQYLPGFCAESVRLLLELEIPTASVAPFDEEADGDVFLGRAELVVTLGRDST